MRAEKNRIKWIKYLAALIVIHFVSWYFQGISQFLGDAGSQDHHFLAGFGFPMIRIFSFAGMIVATFKVGYYDGQWEIIKGHPGD